MIKNKVSLESLTTPEPFGSKFNIIISGQPKMGKSTLACKFPNALCIASKGARTKGLSYKAVTPLVSSFNEAKQWVQLACTEGKDEFDTIVIDDISDIGFAEQSEIEESKFGYGGKAAELILSNELSPLIEKLYKAHHVANKNIVIISQVEYKNCHTEAATYKAWDLSGLLVQAKAKLLYFADANYQIVQKQKLKNVDLKDPKSRKVGLASGGRYLVTSSNPNYIACSDGYGIKDDQIEIPEGFDLYSFLINALNKGE